MEQNSQQHKDVLYSALEEAYGKVVYTYTTQVIHASRLKWRNSALKWLQIILSAVSTGGFLGSVITNQTVLVWVGGLCSTVLLALTAYFKDSEFSNTYFEMRYYLQLPVKLVHHALLQTYSEIQLRQAWLPPLGLAVSCIIRRIRVY